MATVGRKVGAVDVVGVLRPGTRVDGWMRVMIGKARGR